MGCVQLAPGGDEEGRSASGQPDSLGGEETTKGGGGARWASCRGREEKGENGCRVSGAWEREEEGGIRALVATAVGSRQAWVCYGQGKGVWRGRLPCGPVREVGPSGWLKEFNSKFQTISNKF
jgi:hypothetical protein